VILSPYSVIFYKKRKGTKIKKAASFYQGSFQKNQFTV